jgi:hypothetical protein
MPVIKAKCASILVPHHHRHINQIRMPAGYEGRAQIAPFFAPFQAVAKAALTAPKADIARQPLTSRSR